jgi:hypothetical protein
MNKLLLLIALLTMIAALCCLGCGDDDDDDNNDEGSPEPDDDDSDGDDDDSIDDDDDNDDDNDDNDDNDDDTFAAPTPVYGYYEEGGNWPWIQAQLPTFAANDLALFLGMPDTAVGDPDLLAMLQEAENLGVEVRAWILLPRADGYWPGEKNAAQFAVSALAFAEWFRDEGLAIEWIVVDMEMDATTIYTLLGMFQSGEYLDAVAQLMTNFTPPRFDQAVRIYTQLVHDLEALGFYTMVVTYPQILDDLQDGDTSLQDIMETPISPIPWHEVSTMVYTTVFADTLGIPFGPYLVYDYAASTVEWFGEGVASIALGISGHMTDPSVLENEIAAAKAAGVERIQVYSYGSTLTQPTPQDWHEAFFAPTATPASEWSTQLLRSSLRLADQLF